MHSMLSGFPKRVSQYRASKPSAPSFRTSTLSSKSGAYHHISLDPARKEAQSESMLPDRSTDAEDAFLRELAEKDSSYVQEALSAALEARRPRLAARLIGLLDDDDLDALAPEERAQARRAAQLILMESRHDPNAWYYEAQELAELWERTRRRRLEKVKARMRGQNRHPRPRTPRKRR